MPRTFNQYLTQANFLGQGFDISGAYHIPGELLRPILDPDKVGTRTFKFLDEEYTVPDYVTGIEHSDARYLTHTVETRDEFQASFSVKAGVHAGAGGFSGQMEASYSRTFSESSDYSYAYTNFYQHVALLRLDPERAAKALSQGFIDAYQALPDEVTPETLPAFADFFHDFGFYATAELALGGILEYYVAVKKASKLGTETIAAQVQAEYKAAFFAGGISDEIKNSEEFKSYAGNRTVSIFARGGDPELLAQLISVVPSDPKDEYVTDYQLWLNSIKKAPAVADFQLFGVWELIPDPARRQRVHEAFITMLPLLRPRLHAVVSPQADSVPSLVLGTPLTPTPPPLHDRGFQMVVLDREKVGLAGVLHNRYYSADGTSVAAFSAMYDEIAADLARFDFENTGLVLILASFGLSVDRPPSAKLVPHLRAAGSGDKLELWLERSQPSRDPSQAPLSYLLVGVPGMGTRTGVERLEVGKTLLTQEVLFYWQRDVRRYTFSAGSTALVAGEGDAPTTPQQLADLAAE